MPEAVAKVLQVGLHAATVGRIELPHLEHAQARRAHATFLRATSDASASSVVSMRGSSRRRRRMSRRRASAAPRSSASNAAARITSSANVARPWYVAARVAKSAALAATAPRASATLSVVQRRRADGSSRYTPLSSSGQLEHARDRRRAQHLDARARRQGAAVHRHDGECVRDDEAPRIRERQQRMRADDREPAHRQLVVAELPHAEERRQRDRYGDERRVARRRAHAEDRRDVQQEARDVEHEHRSAVRETERHQPVMDVVAVGLHAIDDDTTGGRPTASIVSMIRRPRARIGAMTSTAVAPLCAASARAPAST